MSCTRPVGAILTFRTGRPAAKREPQAVKKAVSQTADSFCVLRRARCRAYWGAIGKRDLERITASCLVLFSFEFCLALLDERLHTLAHILGSEQQVEILALDLQPFFQRGLIRCFDRFLRKAYRDGRLGRYRFRQLESLCQVFAPLHNAIDQSMCRHFLRADLHARQYHLHGAIFAERARQPLRAARSRNHSQENLWLPKTRILRSHDHIAVHGKLAAPAQRESAHRRDHWLTHALDALPRL